MICSVCLVLLLSLVASTGAYEVVYALNAGGRDYQDTAGIEYQEDTAREGYSSNHGARYSIDRVPAEDAGLYQTERYSTKSFSYTLPLHGEGKYLLVLKFCEVFFEEANKKVFDVILNDIHVAIADLDIFREVGHATAHDEHIPFTVSRSKLFVKEGVSEVRNGRLKVSFVKNLDNPKINGIVLVKGADVNEFPQLPPKTKGSHSTAPSSPPSAKGVPQPQLAPQPPPFTSQLVGDDLLRGDEEDDEVVVVVEDRRERRTSGPRHPDPYYSMDSAMITILFIVTATLIPIVILRCRL